MNNIFRAIMELAPGAEFSMTNDDYDTIIWHTPEIAKPTIEEVNAKLAELTNAEPMRRLRRERDRLLVQSDWSQGNDVPVGIRSSYVTYRQQLRDLPSVSTPVLGGTDRTGITSVTWPTKPS